MQITNSTIVKKAIFCDIFLGRFPSFASVTLLCQYRFSRKSSFNVVAEEKRECLEIVDKVQGRSRSTLAVTF